MKKLLRIADVIDWLNEKIGQVAIWLVLFMILIGFLNVVLRYAGSWFGVNLTSNLSVEAQWYMFSMVFLLGAAFALKRDQHVRVDVVYGTRSERTKAWINLLGGLILLLPFCTLIVYLSLPYVSASIRVMESSSDPGGLPRWPIKLIIPVAFALLSLQGVALVIRAAGTLAGYGPTFRQTGD